MAKSDIRAERNRIRAHYEKKFSARLQEKDASIKGLIDANDRLRGSVKELQAALEHEKRLREQQEELIQELRAAAGLSPEELEKFRADLGAKARMAAHQEDIKKALKALSGADPYGAMGLLPGVLMGILSEIGSE